eukprot:CAMPEP_0172670552 /NCGR_PEP_ID=MMETSP1074-20121228/10370_1 /TAXON_ID=2916 /ORGANISM="Ceratium fusus, Strain PA161109" /LENGTH=139 /DNA_ID=CAMNT_0013487479 /DNA_START=76 /DNA_END=495 /DNA_ORIENTATION=-
MDRRRGIALIMAAVAAAMRGSPGFVAAPTGCVRFSAPLRVSAQLGSKGPRTGFRTATMARGGEATNTSDEAGLNPLLPIGVLSVLYGAFLLSYGWLDCTGGDYSPGSVAKCAVVDTLYGGDDLWFQFRCKLKLIDACKP